MDINHVFAQNFTLAQFPYNLPIVSHKEVFWGSAVSNTINLAEKFAHSPRFTSLFQDGMSLVEEAATFLDGEGREKAKGLPRNIAMLYGSESMRLTTRLMQLASWLLLQRAANEGEMNREQLFEEKKKIKFQDMDQETDKEGYEHLPKAFMDLVTRSLTLQSRIITLDNELYGDGVSTKPAVTVNPVSQQIDLLSTALGATKR